MLFELILFTLVRFALAAPQVQLGNTTITGADIGLSKQDFFGGKLTQTASTQCFLT
jgi:hypothetical protein